MKERTLSLPELALVAGTRGILGAGIGLLAAGRITDERRLLIGRVLFAIGAISTIPIALRIFRQEADQPEAHSASLTT